MIKNNKYLCFVLTACCVLITCTAVSAKDMGGWEGDSTYNQLYQASELDKLKGHVQKMIEITPMPGMAPGVGMILKDGDGDKVEIHIGPKWFLGDSIGIKRGEKIKVKGAWAEIEGRDVFMAAKIKKGDFFVLKVRLTKDGKPFWIMSKEELAQEQVEQ